MLTEAYTETHTNYLKDIHNKEKSFPETKKTLHNSNLGSIKKKNQLL